MHSDVSHPALDIATPGVPHTLQDSIYWPIRGQKPPKREISFIVVASFVVCGLRHVACATKIQACFHVLVPSSIM